MAVQKTQGAGMPSHLPTIVLIHGFLGPEAAHLPFRLIPYFRGIARLAWQRGFRTVKPQLPAAGSQVERTQALVRALDRLGPGPLALIGHSQGGIDAVACAARHDPERRIVYVATVATPHRGSVVAENLLSGRSPLSFVSQRSWSRALRDLVPEVSERRLAQMEVRPDVRYASYAGEREVAEQPFWLRPFGRMHDGPNDGLVTVASALWQGARPPVRADHFELAGWSLGAPPNRHRERPFPHRRVYGEIFDEVAEVAAAAPSEPLADEVSAR